MLKNNSLFLRLVAAFVLLLTIFLAVFFGQTLKNNAENSWFVKANETAEKATDNCLSWFDLQQTQLRGIASLFYGADAVTEEEFFDVLDLMEVPGSMPFNSIAYAIDKTRSSVGEYIVVMSSDANTIFSPGVDLAQNEQILSAIYTARSFPGEIVLSSPFKDSHGNLMACLLVTVSNSGKEGVLVATINVLELLRDLKTLHIPKGIHLLAIKMTAMTDAAPRQAEFFQSDAGAISSIQEIHIRVDSGKAHLDYLWAFTSEFSGGPAVELGRFVQVAGSLFSLMLFAAMWLLLKENERVRKKVEERTLELSKAVEKINSEIVEKINVEQALRSSNERVKALSNASFEAIILSDNYICIDLNDTAMKMFGYSKEEAIGSPATIIFSSHQLEKIKRRIKSGDDSPYEAIATRKDGSTFPVFVHGRTMDYFGKKVRVSAMTDISDRKNSEKEKEKLTEQLNQAKKMESIGLMAGGVAHDLNNILSGIIGYPELLLQTVAKDSKLREPLEAIRESGHRAATVVADLLTVARGAASTREVHDINSLVKEYFSSPEYDKLKSLQAGITFQHQMKAAHPAILCSSVHVKKCLMNLVMNAAEAIADLGSVVVSTHNKLIDDIEAKELHLEKGEYVVLTVQDTGPGIAKSDLEHIFEPFYTRKEMGRSGTGLGLTVVWNTMEDHGGKVFVESNDKGTCFKLYYPVSLEKGTVKPENNDVLKSTGNNEHILIVDDDPQLRDIARQMLLSFGYKVDSVSSGELAIDFVKKKPVDLILLDMLMDPGINGRQTYAGILELYPGQKAIIASGFSESEDVKETQRLGAGRFIKKPYTLDQLGQAVKEELNLN